jgi:hypothetical protein
MVLMTVALGLTVVQTLQKFILLVMVMVEVQVAPIIMKTQHMRVAVLLVLTNLVKHLVEADHPIRVVALPVVVEYTFHS